jgi:hypothetical protein
MHFVDRSALFAQGKWYGLATRTDATTRVGLPTFQKPSSIWFYLMMVLLVTTCTQKTLQ